MDNRKLSGQFVVLLFFHLMKVNKNINTSISILCTLFPSLIYSIFTCKDPQIKKKFFNADGSLVDIFFYLRAANIRSVYYQVDDRKPLQSVPR